MHSTINKKFNLIFLKYKSLGTFIFTNRHLLNMTIKDFIALLRQTLGKDIVLCQDTQATPQAIVVPAQRIAEISQALHAHEKTYFDSLSCLTAIDNGPETGTLEVVYNLYSIPYGHALMLKATLPRNLPN